MNSQSTTQIQRYQQPTCLLEVWADHAGISQWSDRPIARNLRYRLKIGDRTLKGNQQQLTSTIDTVISYVDQLLANANAGYQLSHHLEIPRQKQLNISTLQLFDLVANLEQCTNELTLLPSLELEVKRITPNWLKVAAVLVAAIGISLGTVRLITPQIAQRSPTEVASSSAPESESKSSNSADSIAPAAPTPADPEAIEELPELPTIPPDSELNTDAALEDLLAKLEEEEAKSTLENETDPGQIAALPSQSPTEQEQQFADRDDRFTNQPSSNSAPENPPTAPTDAPGRFRRNEASLDDGLNRDAPIAIDNSGRNPNIKPNIDSSTSRRAARQTTPPAKIAGQAQDQNIAQSAKPTAPAANAPQTSVSAPRVDSLYETKDEAAESEPEARQPAEPSTIGRTNELDSTARDRNNLRVIAIAANGKRISNSEQTRLEQSLAQHWRSQNLNNSSNYRRTNQQGTATFLITLNPGKPNQVTLDLGSSNFAKLDQNAAATIEAIERSLTTWQPPIDVINTINSGAKSPQITVTIQIN
jgi:hypothetical protein